MAQIKGITGAKKKLPWILVHSAAKRTTPTARARVSGPRNFSENRTAARKKIQLNYVRARKPVQVARRQHRAR